MVKTAHWYVLYSILALMLTFPVEILAQRQSFSIVKSDTVRGYRKDSVYVTSKVGIGVAASDSALTALNFRVRGGARIDSSLRLPFLSTGTVRSTSGVISSTASDTVGLGTALAGKLGTGTVSGLAAPSVKITATAVTGSGTTAMRSDGSPALDTNYAWTQTGINTFANRIDLKNASYGYANRRLTDTLAGSDQYVFNQWYGQAMQFNYGSAGSPITTPGPSVKISRVEQFTKTSVNNNKADQEATSALLVTHIGTASDSVQAVGIAAQAQTAGATGTGTDALGLYAIGRTINGAVGLGIGAYTEGRRDTANSLANGLEVRAADYSYRTAIANTGSATTGDSTMGIWITGNGRSGRSLGSAVIVGNPFSIPFKYGLVFRPTAIDTTSILDNSSSVTSLNINGTHTNAIITSATAGKVGIGTTSPTGRFHILGTSTSDADKLLNISGTTTGSTIVQNNAITTSSNTSQLTGLNFTNTFNPSGASLSTIYGMLFIPTINSSSLTIGTYSAIGLRADLGASFSGVATSVRLLDLYNPTVSAGAITTLDGLYITNLTSGTTNRGIRLGLSSGANKWNIYADGTATNYFAGNTSIGSTTTTSQFNVGSAAQFQVNSSGAVVTLGNIAAQGPFGVPNIVDTIQQTGQTATIAASNITGTAVNGVYRISVYLYPTTAGTSGTVLATIRWNDGAAESAVTGTHTFGALGTPVFINGQICTVTNSTAITWETTVTASVGGGVYVVNVIAERLF